MSEIHHFPAVSYVSDDFRIEISLDRFSKQFQLAQWWIGEQVLQGCRGFMPLSTGNLQQRSTTETKHLKEASCVQSGGRRVVFPGPYARFLYMGKVMVGVESNSPFARKGERKVATDRPLTYSYPLATDHWFDAAKAQNGEYWVRSVKEMAGGG